MGAVPIALQRCEYVILQLALPGRPVQNIGVLLLDPSTGQVHARLRDDWDRLADADDAELLSHVEDDFNARIREMGGRAFLESLEDSLSNSLRVTERETASVKDFPTALDRIFDQHVLGKPKIIPFKTHLPLYSLRAAATKFGEDRTVELAPEEWVEAPPRIRLTEEMFVCRVVGRSMEPKIPDGSLCIFRANVVGSRQNKLVLIEHFGRKQTDQQYTVKKYTSKKVYTGEDEWQHQVIRLEPLNRDFEAFELKGEEFRVIAEFVQVLR